MTLAEDLKSVVFNARGIAGSLGFRTHRVYILDERWTGQHTGEGGPFPEQNEIVEGSSQPPKVRWLTDEEIAVGGLGSGSIEVGPITPAFSGGGTDLTTIAGALEQNATRYLMIVGPRHPDGARYRITSIRAERALRYMIRAAPSGAAEP